MVGKSTVGRSLTGSARYATMPNNAMAAIRRLVAIGRRMKTSEMFIDVYVRSGRCGRRSRARCLANLARSEELREVSVDDRREVQRKQLRNNQPADNRQPEGPPGLAARSEAGRNRD